MKERLILWIVIAVFGTVAMPTDTLALQGRKAMHVPPDTPEHFMERYGHFVRKDERRAFKQIYKRLEKIDKDIRKLDERAEKGKSRPEDAARRQALVSERTATVVQLPPLIEAFWKPRDPLPQTPENEYKKMIDQRIEHIALERFFTTSETPGLTFRANGGYHGDMAKIYLLHGVPGAISTVEGRSFVPLMLWLYADPSDGGVLYAFMFYQRNSMPPYHLFEQDTYMMDPCGAINEISSRRTTFGLRGMGTPCTRETQLVYRDLTQSMPTGNISGYTFAWALFNFSRDPSIRIGNALAPPEPVADIARRSTARVTGGVPEPVIGEEVKVVRAECSSCRTMIPAELVFSGSDMRLLVPRGAIDWLATGEELAAEMIFMVLMEGAAPAPILHRQTVRVRSSREHLSSGPDESLTIPLFKPQELAAVPAGSYRVTVYLRSTLTNRYNAWRLTYVKH